MIELKKTPGEAGGIITYDCPIDSLLVPRQCATCNKPMHSSWNCCPWCGKKLPQ